MINLPSSQPIIVAISGNRFFIKVIILTLIFILISSNYFLGRFVNITGQSGFLYTLRIFPCFSGLV
ncbi:MAG: hypothetical protein ACLVKO_12915, partial [Dysgonomonas sp.]